MLPYSIVFFTFSNPCKIVQFWINAFFFFYLLNQCIFFPWFPNFINFYEVGRYIFYRCSISNQTTIVCKSKFLNSVCQVLWCRLWTVIFTQSMWLYFTFLILVEVVSLHSFLGTSCWTHRFYCCNDVASFCWKNCDRFKLVFESSHCTHSWIYLTINRADMLQDDLDFFPFNAFSFWMNCQNFSRNQRFFLFIALFSAYLISWFSNVCPLRMNEFFFFFCIAVLILMLLVFCKIVLFRFIK